MQTTRMPRNSVALLLILSCASGACGPSAGPSGSGLLPGTLGTNPQSGVLFLVDANASGQSAQPTLVKALWGRLVDLYALDPLTQTVGATPVFSDLLVDPNATSDGIDWTFEHDALDQRERVTVLHAPESGAFLAAVNALEGGLVNLGGTASGPFPTLGVWPRNATLALVFDDLLDDGGVDSQNVHLEVGYPPIQALGARIFPDPNHGDLYEQSFHTTRVLIAPSVSMAVAQAAGLQVNVAGLPQASTNDQANVRVRIPTETAATAGQHTLLTNLSGHALSALGAGTLMLPGATHDVALEARSGAGPLGDPFNGFLPDDQAPRIVARLAASVWDVTSLGAGVFELDLEFSSLPCALSGSPGDLLETIAGTFEVIAPGSPPSAGHVSDLRVRSATQGAPPSVGPALLQAAFDPAQGHQGECFIEFSPQPGAPPTGRVSPSAMILVRVSEPVDPDSVRALETFTLRSAAASQPLSERVVGQVVPLANLAGFAFLPQLPLSHTQGQSESYLVEVQGGPGGWTDLAGNPLEQALPDMLFDLDPDAGTLVTGGISLTFDDSDEDGNGAPELRGQLVNNALAGTVGGRAVTRFSVDVDGSQNSAASVKAWTPLFGFPEPLSPLGARMQTTWRYHDLGFDLMSDSGHNLDVEGLAWMPENNVTLDKFSQFELSLAHSKYLPDEFVDPTTGGLPYPLSGLTASFDSNLLEPAVVVHESYKGYLVQPVDAIKSSSGQIMAPWPLNREVPLDQFSYWTWRDTAQLAVAGPNGAGVNTAILQFLDPSVPGGVYGASQVPTIGLPLLMQFKVWPDTGALGFNRLMMGMANTVGLPYFRAWSGGFYDSTGAHTVDPNAAQAIGGIDPAGNSIPGVDIGVMYGQADFVTRISRAHTIWFDTGSPHSFGKAWLGTGSAGVPSGTEILLAFRGASSVSSPELAADANQLDPYGDPLASAYSVSYLNGDATWKSDLGALDGARYVQVRLSLQANAATGLVPELTGLGLSYYQ